MARSFQVEFPQLGKKVRARLLDDRAPQLSELFWQTLPFECVPSHPVVSGFSVSLMVPVGWTRPWEHAVSRQEGDIYLYANAQHIVMPYGETTEPNKVNKFAEIYPEDRMTMREIGAAVGQAYFAGRGVEIRANVSRCEEVLL